MISGAFETPSDRTKLSAIELSTSFDISSPVHTIGFEVDATLYSEFREVGLSGFYAQGASLCGVSNQTDYKC